MKHYLPIVSVCLLCVSSAFAAPEDFVIGNLVEIGNMAATTTSVVGVAGPTPVYGVPMDSPSVGWMNMSTSGDVWDFTAMEHNLWITGSVTGASSGGAWATLGLFDKHFSDGLAVGQDAQITYPSGQYGLGRNGGLTIIGGTSVDDQDMKIKVEDGWPKGTGEGQIGLGAFEFTLRYGFLDGSDRDTRTLRGWYREIGGTTWTDIGTYTTLGYPINAYKTERAERYLNDQWDQVMFGITVVNDGGDLPGSYSTGTFKLFREELVPGDANRDGRVDEDDAAALAQNWLTQENAAWTMGDFNGDGKVNDADAAILAANWQSGVSATSASVPEPSLAVLFLTSLATAAMVVLRMR